MVCYQYNHMPGENMQEKKTLFYFLYDNLKQQILSGCRQYGSPLPSLSRLCETYHVGRRTARDVLDALRREGLIHTAVSYTHLDVYKRQIIYFPVQLQLLLRFKMMKGFKGNSHIISFLTEIIPEVIRPDRMYLRMLGGQPAQHILRQIYPRHLQFRTLLQDFIQFKPCTAAQIQKLLHMLRNQCPHIFICPAPQRHMFLISVQTRPEKSSHFLQPGVLPVSYTHLDVYKRQV